MQHEDQKYVFDTFGKRVLDNAWNGYHCCLFAYGQTGAGFAEGSPIHTIDLHPHFVNGF